MRCTYMFMKKHLKTNALFFIFYKESVSDFGNFGFKKPQTLEDPTRNTTSPLFSSYPFLKKINILCIVKYTNPESTAGQFSRV